MPVTRPSLRWLLLGLVVLVLALPLAGLLFLRMYQSALIRQTESELVSQAAVLGAMFKVERLARPLDGVPRAAAVPGPLEIARRTGLDLAHDTVLPSAPDPAPGGVASAAALAAGAALAPVLRDAQGVTLAAMRVLDSQGVIVATTGQDLGLSMAAQEEVRRALQGEPTSVLREREHLVPWGGISRTAPLRVWVVLPVTGADRMLGAVLVARTPADITQALWGKRYALGALALVLLAMGTALAFAVSRFVTKPLQAVTAQAARVAAGEAGLVQPLSRPGTREVAALSAAIAAMAAALERRASYVRTLAAHMAHEFKTPLAAVQGAAELLADHGMTAEESAHFLGVIAIEAARLDRLTRRMLDLARADMAAKGSGDCDVGAAMQRACERFRASGLDVRMEPAGLRAAVPAPLLDGMLEGLLDNAAAHAGPGTTVTLSARETGMRVLVCVQDDGLGVSPANAARIFQPFFTTARAQGGTGLGLPIVAALAASAGGSVRLADSPRGARFELDLPGFQAQSAASDRGTGWHG